METCQICGAEGDTYEYYYGEKEYEYHYAGEKKSAVIPNCEGVQKVVLCEKCVRKKRLPVIVMFFVLAPVTLLFVFLGIKGVIVPNPRWWEVLLCFLAIPAPIISTIFLVLGIKYLTETKETKGSRAAISLNKKNLNEEGFDIFWTRAELLRESEKGKVIAADAPNEVKILVSHHFMQQRIRENMQRKNR